MKKFDPRVVVLMLLVLNGACRTSGKLMCGPDQTLRGGTCTCPFGYEVSDYLCIDIDECITDNGGCGDSLHTICTNMEGADPECTDVDECATNNGDCGDPTYYRCINNLSGPPTCVDVDECATNNGGCGDPTYMKCTNNRFADPTCEDIDECLTNNGGCGEPEYFDCVNNFGAEPTCIEIMDCAKNNGGCGRGSICTNHDDSPRTCACARGFYDHSANLQGNKCVPEIEHLVDYEATMYLRSDDNDGVGIIFRYQDELNYYVFIACTMCQSIELFRIMNGEAKKLWLSSGLAESGATLFRTGLPFGVRVFIKGNIFKVFADWDTTDNGSIGMLELTEPLDPPTDDTHAWGTVGPFFCGDFGAAIEKFEVREVLATDTKTATGPVFFSDDFSTRPNGRWVVPQMLQTLAEGGYTMYGGSSGRLDIWTWQYDKDFDKYVWYQSSNGHSTGGTIMKTAGPVALVSADTDLDGVSDYIEFEDGTDPLVYDSDNDGIGYGTDYLGGSFFAKDVTLEFTLNHAPSGDAMGAYLRYQDHRTFTMFLWSGINTDSEKVLPKAALVSCLGGFCEVLAEDRSAGYDAQTDGSHRVRMVAEGHTFKVWWVEDSSQLPDESTPPNLEASDVFNGLNKGGTIGFFAHRHSGLEVDDVIVTDRSTSQVILNENFNQPDGDINNWLTFHDDPLPSMGNWNVLDGALTEQSGQGQYWSLGSLQHGVNVYYRGP